jgi:nucleoside-diphosphate-sugar epimerase
MTCHHTAAGRPASEYARSKAAGDQLVAQLAREQALPACTCKLACCVGRDPKLVEPAKDVMRIADLIAGKVGAAW